MSFKNFLDEFPVKKNIYNHHEFSKHVNRPDYEYKNCSNQFKVENQTYAQQYCQLYLCRYHQLRPRLVKLCQTSWNSQITILEGIKCLVDFDSCETKFCILIGTLYKDMALKPSVLEEYMKELEIEVFLPQMNDCIKTANKTYLSDTDVLYLEDDTVRILLVSAPTAIKPLPVSKLVTGIVIAVCGNRSSAGHFEVHDWTLPGVPVPRPLPKTSIPPKYVGFVSELNFNSSNINHALLLRLQEFLLGVTIGSSDITQRILLLVVLGNTISNPLNLKNQESKQITRSIMPTKFLNDADAYFAQLLPSIKVDIVPGAKDPANYLLPQQPLHPLLFPKCQVSKSFQSVTNPYIFSINNVIFTGCSGQNVEDIMSFTNIKDPVEALTMTIEAQCICPTAPDTLPCYPFTKTDPFVTSSKDIPHVYFSGSQENFEAKYWNKKTNKWSTQQSDNVGPLALCIPKFSNNKNVYSSLILVDVNTLETREIQFE